MSYDLRLAVKVEGTDILAVIDEPTYNSPTYNIGEMFRKCMGWDFEQGEFYNVAEVYSYIEHGIKELETNEKEYVKYNAPNGWGTTESALVALRSLKECIDNNSKEDSYWTWQVIPKEHLWLAW